MFRFKQLLEEHADEIVAAILTDEHGKVLDDAAGEFGRGVEVVDYACGISELLKGEHSKNVGPNIDSWSEFQPLGVVAGITPFNFPAMVPMWMFPMAIACGNTFVLKPSEKDPSAPIFIARLVKKRLRGIAMLGLIGGGLVASVAATNIASFVDVIPGVGKFAIWGGSLLISVGLYVLAFQLLTDVDLAWKDILPGAVFGGIGWWALQTFGSALIVRQQESAGEAYGDFASIIALLVFLFLAAQVSILGAEISVVKARRLWPRSIVKGNFTEADMRAFELLAGSTRQEEFYDVALTAPERTADDAS